MDAYNRALELDPKNTLFRDRLAALKNPNVTAPVATPLEMHPLKYSSAPGHLPPDTATDRQGQPDLSNRERHMDRPNMHDSAMRDRSNSQDHSRGPPSAHVPRPSSQNALRDSKDRSINMNGPRDSIQREMRPTGDYYQEGQREMSHDGRPRERIDPRDPRAREMQRMEHARMQQLQQQQQHRLPPQQHRHDPRMINQQKGRMVQQLGPGDHQQQQYIRGEPPFMRMDQQRATHQRMDPNIQQRMAPQRNYPHREQGEITGDVHPMAARVRQHMDSAMEHSHPSDTRELPILAQRGRESGGPMTGASNGDYSDTRFQVSQDVLAKRGRAESQKGYDDLKRRRSLADI